MLGAFQLNVLLAEVVGIVVQTTDVIGLPLQAGVIGGKRLFLASFLVEQVAHDRVEIAHYCGVALLCYHAYAVLESLQRVVVVFKLIVGNALIVVERHLVGVILSGGAAQKETSDFKNYDVTAVNLDKEERNPLGHIPIIEYRYNSVNQGAFENCVSLIDAMSEVQSNRVDGVAKFIQSLGVAINCNFDENVTAETIKKSGLIALSSIGDNKADFKILSEELNQDQTQTLVDNLYDQILRICSMPSTRKGGTSTSDTQGAVIFRDGWEQAAACARNTEDLFRESNRYFDEILIDVLKRNGLLDIKLIDFELNFIRNETANVQSKAQAAQTMLAMGMAPELAFKKSGLSNDPVSDVKMSEKYLKMIWGDPEAAAKAEESGNGQGEAEIIEEDNNNGENTAGGV